ncbi:MAG: dTDP-4-dehydrorhamnose reductase [Sulfitobacter sp.]|nr:dTDP-4-dehydrorhamnose reductase [Sulfitobacter sp.]
MILVFGQSGQVARELGALPGLHCLGRADADLEVPEVCAEAIHTHAPRAVINAAAYTAVDRAESEEALATRINAHAPAAMAGACAELGIPLVQISTDYVFAGNGDRPWKPDAPTGPLGAYGRSKLKGEEAVRHAGCSHAILRTSWVISAHGTNFVKTMLRLGAERAALNIVADQIGGPTGAREIAAACLEMARQLCDAPEKSGTYHFSGRPDVSWADFARAIFDKAHIDCAVTDIPSSDYPTPALRPLNSRLDCSTIARTFGIERPDWHATLDHILSDLGASE